MIESGANKYVVFRLGNEQYGFDVASVREIHSTVDIAKVHRTASYIEGVMNLRGKLVTVVNMRRRFEMPPMEKLAGSSKIVVVDAADAPVGFLVDEVIEVATISKESIEKAPPYVASGIEAQYVLGIAKVDDRLITLIDPLKVLELTCDVEGKPGGA